MTCVGPAPAAWPASAAAPHIIEAVLNHKSGKIAGVAKVYNRFEYAKEKAAALDAWARRVDEIVTGRTSTVVQFPARG